MAPAHLACVHPGRTYGFGGRREAALLAWEDLARSKGSSAARPLYRTLHEGPRMSHPGAFSVFAGQRICSPWMDTISVPGSLSILRWAGTSSTADQTPSFETTRPRSESAFR